MGALSGVEVAIRLDPTGQSVEIPCTACHATNRVPVRRLQDRPVCGRCRQRLSVDHPIELTDGTFDALIQHAGLPVLVDFWAPWCAPCRMVAPELERVAREKQGELVVAKLNTQKHRQAPARYSVQNIPTMVLFRAGQEVKRLQGAMPAARILAELG
jgi:thioredoxin 2